MHLITVPRTFLYALSFLLFAGIGCTRSKYKSPVDLSSKPEAVKREFRTITLKNQLDVILISDPDVKQSAAALNVNVGFGEDPVGQEGMAHFLEHMLFLGTEKFPDEGEYSKYIASHQGYNNAYTTFDNTNYYFTINHPGFEGGLDRFAQFFTAPLFTPKFVEREKNAVNNEFQKNKQNDFWRTYELSKSFLDKKHPASKFGTGNSETLKSITRKDLMVWYKKYYSANNMSLALVGNGSLKELEALANKYFSAIPNSNLASPQYTADVLDPKRKLSIVHIQPVKDHKKLNISFYLPPQINEYKNKSYKLVSDLLSAEHQGGLAQTLKAKGWASALYGGLRLQNHQLEISVEVKLTEEGNKRYKDVLKEVFSYIAFIKEKGYPEKSFYENKALAEIYYVYPKFQEGGNYAASMASLVQTYGTEDVLQKAQLFQEKSEKTFQEIVSKLTIENALILYSHKNFKPTLSETIYGAQYKVEELSQEFIKGLVKKIPGSQYQYPAENQYIPENLSKVAQKQEEPKQISKSGNVQLWFQGDKSIGLPRGNIQGHLIFEEVSKSPRNYVLNQLHNKLINQELMEWTEQLHQAGISLSIYPSYAGLGFGLDGFSDKLPTAMANFLERFQKMEFNPQLFKDQKEAYLKDLKNSAYNSAYKQAMAKLKSEINKYSRYTAEHYDEAAALTLNDLKSFHSNFVKEVSARAVAYGNFKEASVQKSFKPIENSRKVTNSYLDSTHKSPEEMPKEIKMATLDNNNSWSGIKFNGPRTPENDAFLGVLSTLLSDKYFTDLRTHQQLGYIVGAFPYKDAKNNGMQFLIQSSNFPNQELMKRTKTWLEGEKKRLQTLSNDEFLNVKEGLLERYRKPFKTSEKFAAHLYSETFVLKSNGYRQKLITSLEKMTLKDFKTQAATYLANTNIDTSISVSSSKQLKN